MSETEYQENLHFITSHPEAVAREMTKRADTITTLRAEVERLRAALGSIKWRSADRDNMEYAATITYSQMDAIRAALAQEKQNDN